MFYFDMDGVLADFDRGIIDFYGRPMEALTDAERHAFWNVDCVSSRLFANLHPIREGVELLKGLREAILPFTILTSTGGGTFHADIAKQKIDFLVRNGLGDIPMAFATGTDNKAERAKVAYDVLIDDRDKCVIAWKNQGGTAFKFTRDNWESILKECVAGNFKFDLTPSIPDHLTTS